MCERIGNYDIATETRELKIQWGKVKLLRQESRKQKEKLHPPFDQIQHNHTGTILGKEISATGNLTKAVVMRIANAQNIWEMVNYKLLRNKAIAPRIKLILWNSLIRSTVIYGLHTKELPRNLIERLKHTCTSTYEQ